MTFDMRRPTRILAVMDDSDTQLALQSAEALAEQNDAAIEVFACVEPPHDLGLIARLAGRDPDRLITEMVSRKQEEVRARLSAIKIDVSAEPHVAVGKPFLEIINFVARSGCDFVVKAAEPLSGIDQFLFASTDQHLLRKCPCPVWLQTPAAAVRPRRVLAAVDLDIWDADEPETLKTLNRRVIETACGIAIGHDAEVIVLHAWDAIGEGIVWAFSGSRDARLATDQYVNEILETRQHAMSNLLASFQNYGTSRPRLVPRLVRGVPEHVIKEQGRELGADLVVLGTVARTGLSGVFIGNTAENIINSLECPVLAVKPEGFTSPLLQS